MLCKYTRTCATACTCAVSLSWYSGSYYRYCDSRIIWQYLNYRYYNRLALAATMASLVAYKTPLNCRAGEKAVHTPFISRPHPHLLFPLQNDWSLVLTFDVYRFAVFDRMKLSTKIIFLYTVDETRTWVSHSLAILIPWLEWHQGLFSTDPATLAPHLRTASHSCWRRTSASYMYTNLPPNLPHDGVEACKLALLLWSIVLEWHTKDFL